ncbi:hypothetical protein ACFSKU_08735 [Pontibacter silvestris]|uniref:Tox-MPTase2 domain-containing protein n=1 Tax=Pontibacter silvestris TaxID=2305183 RepID=A0ABW4WWI7_9BACT|nr:hypothetical protein [Pontibacter silvestris]MCC9138777.1 hypothetical protein [Pontibacter silvestris]
MRQLATLCLELIKTSLDIEVKALPQAQENGSFGMKAQSDGSIAIKMEGNKRWKVSDHANDIKNSFVHAMVHIDEYKANPDFYLSIPRPLRELKAIYKQMEDPNFINTSDNFRYGIKGYLEESKNESYSDTLKSTFDR